MYFCSYNVTGFSIQGDKSSLEYKTEAYAQEVFEKVTRAEAGWPGVGVGNRGLAKGLASNSL